MALIRGRTAPRSGPRQVSPALSAAADADESERERERRIFASSSTDAHTDAHQSGFDCCCCLCVLWLLCMRCVKPYPRLAACNHVWSCIVVATAVSEVVAGLTVLQGLGWAASSLTSRICRNPSFERGLCRGCFG